MSSNTQVSSYASANVANATDNLKSAKTDLKVVERAVAKAERQIAKSNRLMAREEKRLKRKNLSKRSRTRSEKRIADNKKTIKQARREIKRSQRTLRTLKRRVARAERKLKREKRARIAAKERKKRAEANARKAEKTDKATRRTLFGYRADPALKNISDYKARVDNGFQLAAIPVKKLDKRLYRQRVNYSSSHRAGTVVVDTSSRYLYVVERGGTAMRYGIGVGRQGFSWSGTATIGWKREWPTWTPPEEMIARQPKLRKYSAKNGGMEGGIKNPLGARALYLVKDGQDTLYRLHGTPQWNSIGTAASSGCIRLINQDVIDLYNRVPRGAKVVVM